MWVWAVMALGIALVTGAIEVGMGRRIFSESGKILLWVNDINSSECSQQVLDWYSFSHLLHGFLFYGGIYLLNRAVNAGLGKMRAMRGNVDAGSDATSGELVRPPGREAPVLGARRLWAAEWRFIGAVVIEAGWEVLENSPIIIDRYRQGTIALGYSGDSVLNSMADIVCCAAGCMLARRLPVWISVALFVVVEVALAVLIRDNLTLNVIMLVHPVEAIKRWQMGM